jgi:hypothetical protein
MVYDAEDVSMVEVSRHTRAGLFAGTYGKDALKGWKKVMEMTVSHAQVLVGGSRAPVEEEEATGSELEKLLAQLKVLAICGLIAHF